MTELLLRCPTCGATDGVESEPGDPPFTASIVAQCPACDRRHGDAHTVAYYDHAGEVITVRTVDEANAS